MKGKVKLMEEGERTKRNREGKRTEIEIIKKGKHKEKEMDRREGLRQEEGKKRRETYVKIKNKDQNCREGRKNK